MTPYGFIYLTTNKVNGRKYIGRKKGDPSNSGYLGSGKALKAAVEKYGQENFERETLEITYNVGDHEAKEAEWLKRLNAAEDPLFYNLIPFAHGGHLPGMTKGVKKSEETKRRMSESLKERWKDPSYKEYMRLKNLGPRSEETRAKIKAAKSEISKETREKISEAAKKRPPRSREIQERMNRSNTGKKRSEETKLRMSEARKEFWKRKKELET